MINSVLDNLNGIKLIQLNEEYSDLTTLTKEEVQLLRQIIMILNLLIKQLKIFLVY